MSESVKNAPNRESVVQYYKEQIELAELRSTLSKINRDIAVYDAERMAALVAMANVRSAERSSDAKDDVVPTGGMKAVRDESGESNNGE